MSGTADNNPPKSSPPSFGARWAKAIWNYEDEDRPSNKKIAHSIAWMIHFYMDQNGCGVALSDEQISRATGWSESSIQRGKKWLKDKGFVNIPPLGQKAGVKTKFRAVIPVPHCTRAKTNLRHTDSGTLSQCDGGTTVSVMEVQTNLSHTEHHLSHTDGGPQSHRAPYSGNSVSYSRKSKKPPSEAKNGEKFFQEDFYWSLPTETDCGKLEIIPKEKKAKKIGCRIPENWKPYSESFGWAFENFEFTENRLRDEAEKFRDHWLSKSGKDGVKLDWDATWRTWLRNADKFDQQRQENIKRADQRYNNRVNGGRISGKAIPGM